MATDAQIINVTRGARERANAKVLLEGTTEIATDATTTVKGAVELATNAEARTGTDTTRALVPAAVANMFAGLKILSYDGRNGAGACTLVGAVAGDKVLGVFGITTGALGGAAASFETTITVNDQIQQSSASNLSANDYVAVLRAVA